MSITGGTISRRAWSLFADQADAGEKLLGRNRRTELCREAGVEGAQHLCWISIGTIKDDPGRDKRQHDSRNQRIYPRQIYDPASSYGPDLICETAFFVARLDPCDALSGSSDNFVEVDAVPACKSKDLRAQHDLATIVDGDFKSFRVFRRKRTVETAELVEIELQGRCQREIVASLG